MVRIEIRGDKKLYQCGEYGLFYEEEDIAQKCETWCREHKSCNLEIIKKVITLTNGNDR